MVYPPIHPFMGISPEVVDDLPDHFITLPHYTGTSSTQSNSGWSGIGIKDADTVKLLLFTSTFLEGQTRSVHDETDSTAYQNTSGNTAFAIIILKASNTGTQVRHIKVWSGPNADSTTSATLLFEFGSTTGSSFMNNNNEKFTLPVLPIQNNHYLTIENVDDGRAGTNSIGLQEPGFVVERA